MGEAIWWAFVGACPGVMLADERIPEAFEKTDHPHVGGPGRRVRLRVVVRALVQVVTGAGAPLRSVRIADSSAPNRNSHVAYRMTMRSPTTEPIAP